MLARSQNRPGAFPTLNHKTKTSSPSSLDTALRALRGILDHFPRRRVQEGYRASLRSFLHYLNAHHPEISRLEQLQRDPHILGWLAHLKSRIPPLAKNTLAIVIIRLRRLLDDIAWNRQLPALAHLLTYDDVPRKDRTLPRALTPEQDQLIQQELLRRNDLASNILLLQRHTGMRIGECADLSLDCMRSLGPGRWAILLPPRRAPN